MFSLIAQSLTKANPCAPRPIGEIRGCESKAWLRSAGAPKAGGSRTGRGVAHAPGLVALIHGDSLVALIGDRLAGGQHHPTDPLDLIPERVDLNATNQRRLSPVHLVSALCGRTAEQHTAGLASRLHKMWQYVAHLSIY